MALRTVEQYQRQTQKDTRVIVDVTLAQSATLITVW